jgi:hypothetical protein
MVTYNYALWGDEIALSRQDLVKTHETTALGADRRSRRVECQNQSDGPRDSARAIPRCNME